jgi:putative AlgH/UPF0301 family transcriptional regulator
MAKNVAKEILDALGLDGFAITQLEMRIELNQPVTIDVRMIAPFVFDEGALDRFTETLKQFVLVEPEEQSAPPIDEQAS